MLSRMEDESFCCEPENKAQPWLKVLLEQDLWENILWILLLDVSHNLLVPSLHQQPGSCLGDVDGVGRAPCRGATEKRDWNCFVSKLFRVHPVEARAQGQKSEYSQESSLVWSSEEPQESSFIYPYMQIPTLSGPFLSMKHNHTLLWPGYPIVAAIAWKAGHLCFPELFLFSAVSYLVNCLWASWRKECSLILSLCKASCIEVLALAGFYNIILMWVKIMLITSCLFPSKVSSPQLIPRDFMHM